MKVVRDRDAHEEGVMTLQLVLDTDPNVPGIVLRGLIPGRKGMLWSHWPTVQRKLNHGQVEDIAATVQTWVYGRLVASGLEREVEPMG